jgi:hypothetical protein
MKQPKAAVEYSQGHQASHCGPTSRLDPNYCQHFRTAVSGSSYKQGACEKVAGPIRPSMWCKLFKKVEK